jgi:hypothetical protein
VGPRTGLNPLALCEVISRFLGVFTRENKKDLYGDLVHTYGRTELVLALPRFLTYLG